jgi:phenylacetate 2-hydroxylase
MLSDGNATLYVYLAVVLAVGTLIVKYLNQTDIPKIRNLPELPGVPML